MGDIEDNDVAMNAMSAIDNEVGAASMTDEFYRLAKSQWEMVDAAYKEARGIKPKEEFKLDSKSIMALIKKYGPILATGGGGAAVAAIAADEGAFSGIKSLIGGLF